MCDCIYIEQESDFLVLEELGEQPFGDDETTEEKYDTDYDKHPLLVELEVGLHVVWFPF